MGGFWTVLLIVVTALLVLIIVAAFVCCLLCFTRVLKTMDLRDDLPSKIMKLGKHRKFVTDMINKAVTLPHKPIEIRSHDGLRLYADFFEHENADTTLIMMHGWQSCGFNDFGCIIPHFYEKGYNILLVGQRGQWKSGGRCVTMGVKEKYDAVTWCNYIAGKYGKDHNIILSGISMGAATVMYASALDLPANVKGIIADCGFTSPLEISKFVAKERYIYPYPILWFMEMWFWILCGSSMRKDDAREAIKKNTRPIVFLHGEKDRFVPSYMTKEIYEQCTSEKELILVPEARHGQSYLYERERCERTLDDFIARNTGKK